MIVTIAGSPGSGKSTVVKKVAEALGYRMISTGDLRGRVAQERGMTIEELNALNEEWTHRIIDDQVKKIGETEDNIVFDSWLAWHLIPNSTKVFLKVSPEVGAQRVFGHQRPDEKHQDTVEGVQQMLQHRLKEWSGQIKEIYGVDFLDEKNYDFVLDTSDLSIQEVIEKVNEFLKSKK